MSEEIVEVSDVSGESFVEDAPSADAPEVDEHTIREAERLGWVPKEEFRGDEDKWVDAAAFLERGKQINPILRKNNEALQKRIDDLEKKLEETSLSAKEFKAFQRELLVRKEQEYKAQIEELRQQKKDAIAIGDGDAVIAIEDRMEELKATQNQQQARVEQQQPVNADPVFQEFLRENDWYVKDKRMSAFADAIGEEIRRTEPGLHGAAFLRKVVELVKEEMPHKFEKRPQNVVEGSAPSTNRTGSKRKTYENLPADAKAAADKFVREGWMTKEEYVSQYDWGF